MSPPHLHKHVTAVSNAGSNCVNINNLCQRGNIKHSIAWGRNKAEFDRGMTRTWNNQEDEWEKN